MTLPDDRPSLSERYGLATESTDLLLRGERGPVDLLIAAGMIGGHFGPLLMRLHAEFDAVHEDIQRSRVRHRSEIARASQLERSCDPRFVAIGREIAKAAASAAATEFARIQACLRSLPEMERRFAEFAVTEATKQRFMAPDETAVFISGKVLEAHLDPLCPRCNGVGTIGGYDGGPQIICRACGGTRHRSYAIGRTDAERAFASHLLGRLSESLSDARNGMRRWLG